MSWTCNGKTFAHYREASTEHARTGARIESKHVGGTVIRLTDSPSVDRAINEARELSTKLGFPVQIVEVKHESRNIIG